MDIYKSCERSHARYFFQERKQADTLFKGKKGQKFRDEVVKKSKAMPDDEEDGQARNLRMEDVKKIEVIFKLSSNFLGVLMLHGVEKMHFLLKSRLLQVFRNAGIVRVSC